MTQPNEHALTRARDIAMARLDPKLHNKAHLSVAQHVYPAGHILRLVDRTLTVRADSLLVFVDEMPGANFGHPCRYQFYSPITGELLHTEQASFPPTVADPGVTLDEFHAPLRMNYARPKVYDKIVLAKPHWPVFPDDNRFALLISGQISNRRHIEDLEFAWRVLRHRLGFPAMNIYVLCYNGTIGATDATAAGMATWVGDNTPYEMKVHASVTKANIQQTLTTIGNRMNSDSLLFVHTNNHGSYSGLCIDNSTVLTPAEWGTMLQGMPNPFGSLVVTMEQCYSGAFSQPTLDHSRAARTSFASAVPADKPSAGAAHFDPWAQVWFESINGVTVYGGALPGSPDTNNNYKVSVKEAFNYSKTYDPALATYDDPQYADSPAGCGAQIHLVKSPSLLDIIKLLESKLAAVRQSIGPNPPDPEPFWVDDLVASAARIDAVAQRLQRVAAVAPVHLDHGEATVMFPTAGAGR
jgi:Peptidase C13 family